MELKEAMHPLSWIPSLDLRVMTMGRQPIGGRPETTILFAPKLYKTCNISNNESFHSHAYALIWFKFYKSSNIFGYNFFFLEKNYDKNELFTIRSDNSNNKAKNKLNYFKINRILFQKSNLFFFRI